MRYRDLSVRNTALTRLLSEKNPDINSIVDFGQPWIVRLWSQSRNFGYTIGRKHFNHAMLRAAENGNVVIFNQCYEFGARDVDHAMVCAINSSNCKEKTLEFIWLCREYGSSTGYDRMMFDAASGGNIGIVRVCITWGATAFISAMAYAAAKKGHTDIFRLLKTVSAASEPVSTCLTACKSSIKCAKNSGHTEIVKLCEDYVLRMEYHELLR